MDDRLFHEGVRYTSPVRTDRCAKGQQRPAPPPPPPQLPWHLTHPHFHPFHHHHQRSRPQLQFAISQRRMCYLGSLLMEWSRSLPRPGQCGPAQSLLNIPLILRNSGHTVREAPSEHSVFTCRGIEHRSPSKPAPGGRAISWARSIPKELGETVFHCRHSLCTL